jgi:hypothetical protein
MIFLVTVTAHDFGGPNHAIIRCKDEAHQERLKDALAATVFKYPHIQVASFNADSMDVFEATYQHFFDPTLIEQNRTRIV